MFLVTITEHSECYAHKYILCKIKTLVRLCTENIIEFLILNSDFISFKQFYCYSYEFRMTLGTIVK